MRHWTTGRRLWPFVFLLLMVNPLPLWSMPPEPSTRVMILFDTSGSMRRSDTENLSRTAAQLFLELARPQDALGLVDFSDRASLVVPVTPLSSQATKRLFQSRLQALTFNGQTTDLAAALEQGLNSFPPKTDDNSRDLVLLLTDGKLDLGPSRRSEEPLALTRIRQTVLPEYRRRGIALYTIAFTAAADRDLLREFAYTTAGEFRFIADAAMLHEAFGQLFILANQAQSLPLKNGAFVLDNSIHETSLILSKQHPHEQVSLITPNGLSLQAGSHHAGMSWRSTPSYDLVHLSNPEAGTWAVQGSAAVRDSIAIIGASSLGLHVQVSPGYLEAGTPIHLSGFLQDEGQKILNPPTGTMLQAELTTPGGKLLTFPLPYQGEGVFADTLPTFQELGKYELVLTATSGTLQRRRTLSFPIYPRCFQSAIRMETPPTAMVALTDACPRFGDLVLDAGLSLGSGGTTWFPLALTPQGRYQAILAASPAGSTGKVTIRIRGRLQGGEMFTLMKGPWSLSVPPVAPQVERQSEAPSRLPSIFLAIGLLLLMANAGLGVVWWREQRARQRLQVDLADVQKRHDTYKKEMEKASSGPSPLARERQLQQINTSIQYVTDNVTFLQDTLNDLAPLLAKYAQLLQAVKEQTVTPALLDEVEALLKQTGVDYLLEEGPKATQQALEGIACVTNSVTPQAVSQA